MVALTPTSTQAHGDDGRRRPNVGTMSFG